MTGILVKKFEINSGFETFMVKINKYGLKIFVSIYQKISCVVKSE